MQVYSFWGIVIWLLVYGVIDITLLLFGPDIYIPIWIQPFVGKHILKDPTALIVSIVEFIVVGSFVTYIVRKI